MTLEEFKKQRKEWNHKRELVYKENQRLAREYESLPWYKKLFGNNTFEDYREKVIDNWRAFRCEYCPSIAEIDFNK